jgi:hypothetical protein
MLIKTVPADAVDVVAHGLHLPSTDSTVNPKPSLIDALIQESASQAPVPG